MHPIPFTTFDWSTITPTRHEGTTGHALWYTLNTGSLRLRKVVYSPHYTADHWCEKGHFVTCIEGAVTNELLDGTSTLLTPGKGYVVSDGMSSHRSVTGESGAVLIIVDGEFLA